MSPVCTCVCVCLSVCVSVHACVCLCVVYTKCYRIQLSYASHHIPVYRDKMLITNIVNIAEGTIREFLKLLIFHNRDRHEKY